MYPLTYSIRHSQSGQACMDKMWESKSNHNSGSDKDVGSNLRFQNLRKKEGFFYIHEQDEMSLIVQSNTLINPCFRFYVRGVTDSLKNFR